MGINDVTGDVRRFKQIREEQNLTQTEFAEALGIKNSTADIERGRTKLSGQIVTELLRLYNINPLWLFGYSNQKLLHAGKGDVSPKVVTVDINDNENLVMVNQKAAAGYPHNVQDVDWYQQLPAFDLPLPQYRNATYRGFQIEGDSMMPNFMPEDWVLGKATVNMGEATNNKVYVVVLPDAVVVKKLQKLPDPSKVLLISLNQEYHPFEVQVSDIQELWQVNSKLTFHLDAPSQSNLLRELQQGMLDLKNQMRTLK